MRKIDWYLYDRRWDWFAKDRDDFEAKFVVEGKFHEGVPKDIVKSFETVSYLLAHSYYHWPMMDEAMTKLLLILEMVVKLKAQELEISLERKTKSNKIITKRLIEIINDIFQDECLLFLKPDFDRARNLRNMKMHPDKHSFTGAMGFTDSYARFFVNIINLLFQNASELKDLGKKTETIDSKLQSFKTGLHILEFQNIKILIYGFHMFKYREFKNNRLLILYVNPLITNVYEQLVEHKYPEPLIITFIDFKLKEDSIEGVDLEGKPMRIYKNDKEENLKMYQEYLSALSKISEIDIGIFSSSNSSKALWKIERIVYENCWIKSFNL